MNWQIILFTTLERPLHLRVTIVFGKTDSYKTYKKTKTLQWSLSCPGIEVEVSF